MHDFTVNVEVKYEFTGKTLGRSYRYKAHYCKVKAQNPQDAVVTALNTKLKKKLEDLTKQGQKSAQTFTVRIVRINKVTFKLPAACGACGAQFGLENAWVDWRPTEAEAAAMGGPQKIVW